MPAFLVTIDTEGDHIWSAPREPRTRNARYLQRFQTLCERHRVKPTYLTDWEMAGDPVFQELACDALARSAAEVGMHLHPWHQPPIEGRLGPEDWRHQPYLIEYPRRVLREKVRRLTARLEDSFGLKMVSHRAGRWSFDAIYARALVEEGYLVDCSVTPHVSWREHLGDPAGRGGTDYRRFPESEYFVSLDDISRPGRSPLLELPMTIMRRERSALVEWVRHRGRAGGVLKRATNRLWRPILWMRPDGRNLSDMQWVMDRARAESRPYVEFMLHSSELMPGGSPAFPRRADIERLYSHLDRLFARAADTLAALTLRDYRDLRRETP